MFATRFVLPGVLVSSIVAFLIFAVLLMLPGMFLKSVVMISASLLPVVCLSLFVCLCVQVLELLRWRRLPVRSRLMLWIGSEVMFLALSVTGLVSFLLVGILEVG